MMKLYRNLIAIMMMSLMLSIGGLAQQDKDKGKRPDQGQKTTDRGVREENKNRDRDSDRRNNERDKDNKGPKKP